MTGKILIHGRGNKDRFVYMGSTTRRMMMKLRQTMPDIQPETPLFEKFDGDRTAVDGLQSLLRKPDRRSRVEHVH